MLKALSARVAVPRSYKPAATRLSAFNMRPMRFYSNQGNELKSDSTPSTYSGDFIVKYTENHEWIAAHEDKVAFVGITKYAADALGDTTYVEVNDVPSDVEAGDSVGSVESVKSASDVYAPSSGKLIERNEELISNPALLNQDPMGDAWLVKMEVNDLGELENLSTLEQYKDSLEDH